MPSFLMAALAWGLWCAWHSLAIDSALARLCRRLLGPHAHAYRLLYNLTSLLTATTLFFWQQHLPARTVLILPGWSVFVRVPLSLLSLYLFVAGCQAHDCRAVLGIAQLKARTANAVRAPSADTLISSGILGRVRHPWYTAGILLLWTPGSYTDVTLAVHLVLTAYFIIGSILEERRLLARFGDAYREYQQRVPMLIPRLRRK